jgi:hypothetical protein
MGMEHVKIQPVPARVTMDGDQLKMYHFTKPQIALCEHVLLVMHGLIFHSAPHKLIK